VPLVSLNDVAMLLCAGFAMAKKEGLKGKFI